MRELFLEQPIALGGIRDQLVVHVAVAKPVRQLLAPLSRLSDGPELASAGPENGEPRELRGIALPQIGGHERHTQPRSALEGESSREMDTEESLAFPSALTRALRTSNIEKYWRRTAT